MKRLNSNRIKDEKIYDYVHSKAIILDKDHLLMMFINGSWFIRNISGKLEVKDEAV